MNNNLRDTDVRATFDIPDSARSVFKKLYTDGPATRPELCDALGLSRPTMSTAIANLDKYGFVESIGEVQGATGRKAAKYRLGSDAGHVIAVDAGSSHIHIRVTGLNKKLLYDSSRPLSSYQHRLSDEISRSVAQEVETARAKTRANWGVLRAIGIAVPARVVSKGNGARSTGQEKLFTRFTPPSGVPLILENNVNCAAVAERNHGAATAASSFAYIQIGLKIGMGVYLDGQLIRGRNGAAGEIGHLPFPFAPGVKPEAGELESYMGAAALLARASEEWSRVPNEIPAPKNTETLLRLAEAGNETALKLVYQHAEDIGAIVASCVGTIDPGLIVLGGGIGNSPFLLPRVREVTNRLSYKTIVESSALGPDATVLGIERLATDFVCKELMGMSRDSQPLELTHTSRSRGH